MLNYKVLCVIDGKNMRDLFSFLGLTPLVFLSFYNSLEAQPPNGSEEVSQTPTVAPRVLPQDKAPLKAAAAAPHVPPKGDEKPKGLSVVPPQNRCMRGVVLRDQGKYEDAFLLFSQSGNPFAKLFAAKLILEEHVGKELAHPNRIELAILNFEQCLAFEGQPQYVKKHHERAILEAKHYLGLLHIEGFAGIELAEEARIAKGQGLLQPNNPQALRFSGLLYLKGIFGRKLRTNERWKKAEDCFEDTIRLEKSKDFPEKDVKDAVRGAMFCLGHMYKVGKAGLQLDEESRKKTGKKLLQNIGIVE
jgi:tetratricopeptide (TPR) repeat protein